MCFVSKGLLAEVGHQYLKSIAACRGNQRVDPGQRRREVLMGPCPPRFARKQIDARFGGHCTPSLFSARHGCAGRIRKLLCRARDDGHLYLFQPTRSNMRSSIFLEHA